MKFSPCHVLILSSIAVLWSGRPCAGLEVRRLYPDVILDQKSLHRNIISLNLLPKRLPVDKLSLLETQLKLQLATRLWSPEAKEIKTEDLALYIQALHASCINPFDFYGVNLVQMLKNQTSQPEKHNVTPFEDHLSTLTLCMLSRNESDFKSLAGSAGELADFIGHHSNSSDSDRQQHFAATSDAEKSVSANECLMKALAVSCYAKLVPHDRNIRIMLNDLMANVFLTQNRTTGSFNESVVTTSLAVQAFIESGLDRLSFLWDRRKAANFLMSSVRSGDIDATLAYYLVPAFHRTWREVQCWNSSRELDQDAEQESARDWTRALNVVLNQADSSVNVTLSRWIYDSSGEKRKVSVNIPPEGNLLKALKEAVKSSTTYRYNSTLTKTANKNQTDQQSDHLLNRSSGNTTTTGTGRSFTKWVRSLFR